MLSTNFEGRKKEKNHGYLIFIKKDEIPVIKNEGSWHIMGGNPLSKIAQFFISTSEYKWIVTL